MMQLECSICTDPITGETSEIVCSTHCGHIFHNNCLTVWINTSSTCPQCRSNIDARRNIRLFLPLLKETTKVSVSSKILPLKEFRDLKAKIDREEELRKAVTVAIESLTMLKNKMKQIHDSENLAENSIHLSRDIRTKLSRQGILSVNNTIQDQLKTTEQKVKQSLTHIDVFRDKMFVVNRSLLELMDDLNISGRGDAIRKTDGFNRIYQ